MLRCHGVMCHPYVIQRHDVIMHIAFVLHFEQTNIFQTNVLKGKLNSLNGNMPNISNQKKGNNVRNKRKFPQSDNANGNATVSDKNKRPKNLGPSQPLSFDTKTKQTPKSTWGQAGKGKLTPKNSCKNSNRNEMTVSQVETILQGDLRRESSVESQVMQQSASGSQNSVEDPALVQRQVVPHDGVELSLVASDEEFFAEEEQAVEAAVQQQNLSQGTPERPRNSDENETTLSAKKQILKEEMCWDPSLKALFREVLEEERNDQVEARTKQAKHRGNLPKNDERNLGEASNRHSISGAVPPVIRPMKSPSDSTLYTPALKKIHNDSETYKLIEKISNFVESIRMESEVGESSLAPRRQREMVTPERQRSITPRRRLHLSDEEGEDPEPEMFVGGPSPNRESVPESPLQKAERIVRDAEKMKANLIAPKGMLPIKIDHNIEMLRNLDNDDDFFHVSCHIDSSLKQKIERGEFIELDKLLPRDKAAGGFSMEEEHGIQIVSHNGHAYLTPPTTEQKISNLKSWDQAFRVYATIFTQANPECSSEVLQYIHIIHTVASTYSWANVAFYNFMFRRLMATKPWRSWAKTYTQGRKLALKDPALKVPTSGQGARTPGGGTTKSKGWRDDCCWHFNKGNSCKNGSSCKWDHRCTYCGFWNHGFSSCHKRLGKNGKETKGKERGDKVAEAR